MFDLGGGELLLIVLAVLVLFGPKKLPELAQSLGRGMREFKRAQREFTEQINQAVSDDAYKAKQKQELPKPDGVVPRASARSPRDIAPPTTGDTPTTSADAAPATGTNPASGSSSSTLPPVSNDDDLGTV